MSDKALSHGDGCECARCRGFQPGTEIGLETRFDQGNTLSLRHGAYSAMQLAPRAEELADVLRASMGLAYNERFEIAIRSAAAVGARFERAMLLLTDSDGGNMVVSERLERDARNWAGKWAGWLDRLGLTPLAASRQGLNLALGHDAAQRALDRHIDQNYPGEVQP